MLTEAGRLYPVGGLRPATVRTVLGLLACTGMRPAEAVRLTESDADLSAGRYGEAIAPCHMAAHIVERASSRPSRA